MLQLHIVADSDQIRQRSELRFDLLQSAFYIHVPALLRIRFVDVINYFSSYISYKKRKLAVQELNHESRATNT